MEGPEALGLLGDTSASASDLRPVRLVVQSEVPEGGHPGLPELPLDRERRQPRHDRRPRPRQVSYRQGPLLRRDRQGAFRRLRPRLRPHRQDQEGGQPGRQDRVLRERGPRPCDRRVGLYLPLPGGGRSPVPGHLQEIGEVSNPHHDQFGAQAVGIDFLGTGGIRHPGSTELSGNLCHASGGTKITSTRKKTKIAALFFGKNTPPQCTSPTSSAATHTPARPGPPRRAFWGRPRRALQVVLYPICVFSYPAWASGLNCRMLLRLYGRPFAIKKFISRKKLHSRSNCILY